MLSNTDNDSSNFDSSNSSSHSKYYFDDVKEISDKNLRINNDFSSEIFLHSFTKVEISEIRDIISQFQLVRITVLHSMGICSYIQQK